MSVSPPGFVRATLRPTAGAPLLSSDLGGLDAVRLVMAWLVLLSHSWPLSGAGSDPLVGGESLGAVAVAGFFAISGYLVTGSRLRLSMPRFAWHRFLRIFPAYWTMLIVVTFAMAPAVSLLANERWTPRAAAHHLRMNWTTHVQDFRIYGTLTHTPHSASWNGSTWTLYFEVLCYLFLAFVLVIPALRRSPHWLAFAAGALLLFNLFHPHTTSSTWVVETALQLASLAGPFAAGVVLRLYAGRIPLRTGLAALAVVLMAGACLGGLLTSVGAFPTAYVALWLGDRLPFRALPDLSYGVYIYAFPLQQGLVDLGFLHDAPFRLAAVSSVLVVPVAAASWFLIERPALSAKGWQLVPLRRGAGPDPRAGSRALGQGARTRRRQ